MSKLIVEMEMPRKNRFCGLQCADLYCVKTSKKCNVFDTGKRPDWCPIKGVLPDEHGDLIDRDAFIHKYLSYYTEQERKLNLRFTAVNVKQQFADMICDEQAVIAAERKDDGTTAD